MITVTTPRKHGHISKLIRFWIIFVTELHLSALVQVCACLSVWFISLRGLVRFCQELAILYLLADSKLMDLSLIQDKLQLPARIGQNVGSIYIGQLFSIDWIVCVRSWQVIAAHWVSDWASHISSIALGQIWTELIANHKLIQEDMIQTPANHRTFKIW